MPTYTTNFNLAKPLVNNATDQDLWGNELNSDLDSVDTLLRAGITIATQSSQTTGFTADVSISVKKLYPCNATGGAFAATLPTAAVAGNGATVYFKKTDSSSNKVTITCTGGDTIDGASTLDIISQNDCYGIVSNGVSAWNPICEITEVAPAFSIVTQEFSSSGTYTPTSGMKSCIVEVIGGGGGGGGSNASSATGGGGGAGAYSKGVFSSTTIGVSKTVTIGSAGSGGAPGSDGGAGTASSFGALIINVGGGGGGGAGTSGFGGLAGVGGSAGSGGGANISGVPGGAGYQFSTNYLGGNGGTAPIYGAGGASLRGYGVNTAGNAATGFGSGGGGAVGSGVSGGNGLAGYVFITEYIFN